MSFLATLKKSLSCTCPRCGTGKLYQDGFLTMTLHKSCASCGLDLSKNDSADGPAVFLIFILGFLLVPLALLTETMFHPPLWVHGVVWGAVALGLTIGSLKPLKSYIIALQYKHLPWE
jgi:uncharacterized protein (DUF983 family)